MTVPGGNVLERACRLCGAVTERTRRKGMCWNCAQGCQHPETDKVRLRKRNGDVVVKARCVDCGDRLNTLPKTEWEDAEVLPLVSDGVDFAACVRCGAIDGVERHHFAPSGVFGFDEASRWPVADLCPRCHGYWHKMMRRA